MTVMQEFQCDGCGGSGQIDIPSFEYKEGHEPMIMHVISTCQVCGGTGRVMIPV